MKFDWTHRQHDCYQLYVVERKPLAQVRQILKDKYGFEPSERAFQVNFKKWGFPGRHTPAHKNQSLVERVHELWQNNATQQEMQSTLRAEGHEVNPRSLVRLRAKHGWMLRGGKGFHETPNTQHLDLKRKQGLMSGNAPDLLLPALRESAANTEHDGDPAPEDLSEVPPQEASRTQARVEKEKQRERLQARSDESYASKKRRRRTRGFAGLPADPPGPPRFPSETTIDESKAFLHLDNDLYNQARDTFQTICEEAGFVKKTEAGPEKWQAAKSRLTNTDAHLHKQFHGPWDGISEDTKKLALDIVCMDVTKRMRSKGRRMSIADAKSVLGLNPEQSRLIRSQFYDILEADHFSFKNETGAERWNEMKQQWISESPVIQAVLAKGDAIDPQDHGKQRALEVLCRDVMKRLRDDQTTRDPSGKLQQHTGPGPGPAIRRSQSGPAQKGGLSAVSEPLRSLSLPYTQSPSRSRSKPRAATSVATLRQDPSIDPDLSDPALALQAYAASADATANATAASTEPNSNITNMASTANPTAGRPVAALFRLNQSSPVQAGPKMWMDQLFCRTSDELWEKAGAKHPSKSVKGVEGVLSGDASGFAIQKDDELGAYLECVAGMGRVVFAVILE